MARHRGPERIDEMNITASTNEPSGTPFPSCSMFPGTVTAEEPVDCGCGGATTTEPETPETDVVQEPCPDPVSLHIDGCRDATTVNGGDVVLESLGRILQIDVTLKNICPNKRVALAVFLTEVDDKGHEFPRGLKTLLIPAHHRDSCRDITVRCIKFVLPEELDVSGRSDAICDRRNFKARFLANYVDTDFRCCDAVT